MAECSGCLRDLPLVSEGLWPAEHVEPLGKHTRRFTRCLRGPIERELRALEVGEGLVSISRDAARVYRDAYCELLRRGGDPDDITIEPHDVLSEAAEAAAELRL